MIFFWFSFFNAKCLVSPEIVRKFHQKLVFKNSNIWGKNYLGILQGDQSERSVKLPQISPRILSIKRKYLELMVFIVLIENI